MNNGKEGIDFVICRICQKHFKRITNSHLREVHGITEKEYKERFPDDSMVSSATRDKYGNKTRNKSYEEIYGEERGESLRNKHKEATINQMKDQKQIQIRKEKLSGVEKSDEMRSKLRESKTVHGAYNYRERALEYYGLTCMRCGKTFSKKDLVVHHRNLLNVPFELGGNNDLDNLMVVCSKCHYKLHREARKLGDKFVGSKDIEIGTHYVLRGLKKFGLNIHNQHFVGTPKRVARAYAEIFEGVRDTDKQVEEILSTAFKSDMDQMIVVKDIHVFSMCPHHLLPTEMYVDVAYLPKGYVLGLSKLPRLVEIFAKRPVIQEQLTEEITKYLMSIKASGAAVRVRGQHFCMRMRGANKPEAVMITTSVAGVFKEDQLAKNEFLSYIQDGKSF